MAPTDEYTNAFDRISGYFEAPITGQYRFHQSCDNSCQFYLNSADGVTPSGKTLLMDRSSDKTFRSYHYYTYGESAVGSVFSNWISLTANQKYYVEQHVTQGSDDVHSTVGFEVQPSNPSAIAANHPMTTAQYQRLAVTQDIYREKSRLVVQNPDFGTFTIIFTNPTDLTEIFSGQAPAGGSAAELQAAIWDAYITLIGVGPTVTLGCYDNADVEQGDCSAITAYDCSAQTCQQCQDASGLEILCTEYLAVDCITTLEVVCDDPLDTACVPVSEERATCPTYSYTPIYKYDIEVPKSISGYSWSFAYPLATGFNGTTPTNSLLTMQSAESLGFKSNPPLNGTYVIKCYDSDDLLTPYVTAPFNFNANKWDWIFWINLACPTLRNNFDIIDTYDPYYYKEDGINMLIWFKGVSADMPQFEILVNDQDYDNTGKEPLQGGNLQISNTISQAKGKGTSNLYYPFIPFEYLYTYETTPQITAKIAGLSAACKDLNCDYSYEAVTAEITSMNVNSLSVDIIGTSLPTDIDQVTVGSSGCTIVSNDGSTLTCTLDSPCMAGNFEPDVRNPQGSIPVVSGFTKYNVALVVSTVTPDTALNPAGGDILTINGSGFPSVTTAANFRIEFDDGTPCDLVTAAPTVMTCMTQAFDPNARRRQLRESDGRQLITTEARDLFIVSDTLTSSTIEVKLNTDPLRVESITPSSASPILIKTLTLQLSSSYDGDILTDEFSIVLVPRDADSRDRALNVVGRNAADNTLEVKYGGAYSGVYDLVFNSAQKGNFMTDTVTFTAKFEVSDFQPKQGSKMGGTLVTITGEHFSDSALDNPVKIDYQWVGGVDHYCYVQETSDTQIKCRMATDYNRNAGQAPVIVFAGTSEENTWANGVDENFTFLDTDSLPTISSFSQEFNTNKEYVVTITGTSITDVDVSTVDVYFGGELQETIAVSSTEIQVKLTQVPSGSTAQTFEVYTQEGVPNGWSDPSGASPTQFDGGITFNPQLIGLSANEGSSAGATIYAEVIGAGVNDAYTLSSGSTDICESSTMIDYSLLECVVSAQEFTAGTQLSIKNTETNAVYACGNTDVSKCQYQTYATVDQPLISTVSLDAAQETVTFTGTQLDKLGSDCEMSVLGISATTCSIASATEGTATFDLGFPVTETAVVPTVQVTGACGVDLTTLCSAQTTTLENKMVVSAPATVVGLDNALVVSNDASKSLQCSYAGGCIRTIEGKGLATSIQAGRAEVQVCGRTCVLDEVTSTSSEAKCEVPAIQSTKSLETFTIWPTGQILGDVISSSSALSDVAFDESNFPVAESTGSNCYIGTFFPGDQSGYMVGIVNEFRFFMDYFSDKSVYQDNLKFQGTNTFSSEGGSVWDDILTVGIEVHEGWNYYKLQDEDVFGPSYVLPKYRYYRLYNAQSNGCDKIGEVNFIGTQGFDSTATTHNCDVSVYGDDISDQHLAAQGGAQVEYVISKTPYLSSISPRYGTVAGGDTVTFTGENFKADTNAYTILIDGQECVVSTATTQQVQCLTASRYGTYEADPTLSIFIDGEGYVATDDRIFRYVSLWSDENTWGGLFAPVQGESVAILKGTNILVDVNPPVLNLVIVDGGSLIFPSNDADESYEATFDAHYIFLNDGALMEVGTRDEPYRSKLTISMHGARYDPYIPKFGNKCIAVHKSVLDMHGIPRAVTWTSLESTASIGDTQIVLQEAPDWNVGEEIVIASTDLGIEDNEIAGEGDRSEVRIITAISGTTVSFAEPLLYEHYADIDYYGDNNEDFIEMRAEVGLLTRNIKFQGDTKYTAINQYGATIMLHSPGDETSAGRVEYVEFFNVGQAFQLGRYPIHFHMIGEVTTSYVHGNSFRQSFNRGTTIHGVHYLHVTENVYYHCKGHNVFIEDGVETKNYIYKNLVVQSKASHSILNTDTTPASFWITNPDNIWVGNHAAGGPRYGFWFDLQVNSIGPSASSEVCPIAFKLGEFRDNVAHSMGRYGLRIFHEHTPRTFPCQPVVFDETAFNNGEDPYHSNPVIPAYYQDSTFYKNGRNGVITEDIGAVRFVNIKTVDNILGGIEVNRIFDVHDDAIGGAYIENAVVVGRSQKSIDDPTTFQGTAQDSGFSAAGLSPHGVITPQDDYFKVKNVRFYNFNFNEAAPIGTCSHCFKEPATDSDGRTVAFSNTYIHPSTVNNKIRYQFPYKTIIYDEDGTLTGQGAGSWAINDAWNHNIWENECWADPIYDGLLCNNQVTVRRLLMSSFAPSSLAQKDICVIKYDDSLLANLTSDEIGQLEAGNTGDGCSWIEYRPKARPANHWTAPFVTGHTYYMRWLDMLDFEEMQFSIIEPLWNNANDKDIRLHLPFNDAREHIYVDPNGVEADRIANKSLVAVKPNNKFGANYVYNETFEDLDDVENQQKYMIMAVNADTPQNPYAASEVNFVKLTGIRPIEVTDVIEGEVGDEMLWSSESSWSFDPPRIPMDGDEIVINSTSNIILDIPASEAPKLVGLEINGALTFLNDGTADRAIRAHKIWVRAGTLNIGNATHPFTNNAEIELLGDNTQYFWSFSRAVEIGNKNLVITGDVNLYGSSRPVVRQRLLETAYAEEYELQLEQNLDFVAGEKLGVAATNMRTMDYDECTIDNYNALTGVVTCKERLKGYHYGNYSDTIAKYEVDMRAEVWLMDKNIKIFASLDDIGTIIQEPWGCQILVSDFREPTLIQRIGNLNMDNVQVYNCSQKNTYKGALRWEGAIKGKSKVSNSVISSGKGMGITIENAANVVVEDTVVADFVQQGIWVKSAQEVTLERNWVHMIRPEADAEPKLKEFPILTPYVIGGITASERTSKITIRDNVVSGSWHHGYHYVPERCDSKTRQPRTSAANWHIFEGNIAHSISGYGALGLNQAQDCTIVRDFIAYKCTEAALHYGGPSLNVARNLVSIDSVYGISVHSGDGKDAEIYDSRVYGEPEDNGKEVNLDHPPNSPTDHCLATQGITVNFACDGEHADHHIKWFKFPLFKFCLSGMTSQGLYSRVQFIDFTSNTKKCGQGQRAIGTSQKQSDYVGLSKFYRPVFDNVAESAMFFIHTPSQGWINWEDCGIEFTCTGLYNVVLKFEDVSFTGSLQPKLPRTSFDLTSNNRESVSIDVWGDTSACDFYNDWNAWLCEQDYAILIFDSLDDDRMDRSAQPIWIYGYQLDKNGEEQPICNKAGECFKNRLNAFMDHCWDGFYTCQQREQRFPTMVYQPADTYWIEYTGTPPKSQKFVLHSDVGGGFKVRIKYSDAGAYAIYNDDNNVIEPTDWDSSAGTYADLPRRECGENRYQGVVNILEFYIEPDCPLTIRPRDAIMLGVRLEFTMDQFFATGGVVSFVDRMAGALGIHRSDIRVAGVQAPADGQTKVDFEGFASDDDGRRLLSDGSRRQLLSLDEITAAFNELVSDEDEWTNTFPELVLLGADAVGIPIIVPNTPFDEEGNPIFDFVEETSELIGLDLGLDEREETDEILEKKDPEVKIQIKYKEKLAQIEQDRSSQSTMYMLILVCMLLIIVLIFVAICLYRKLGSEKQIAKDVDDVLHGKKKGDPRLSIKELDEQYDPKKAIGMLYDVDKNETAKRKRKQKQGDFLEVADVDESLHNPSSGPESVRNSVQSHADLNPNGRGSTAKLNPNAEDDSQDLTPKKKHKVSTNSN